MGPGDVYRMPPAAVGHGRAGKISGTGPCEEVKVQGRDLVRVVGIVAPFAQSGSVPEENSFYRASAVERAQKTCAGTGPSASCGYCCPLCPTRGRYPRKIRFIEPQRLNEHRRPVRGAPSSGTPQESQVVPLFHNVPYRVPLFYRETPSPQSTPLL